MRWWHIQVHLIWFVLAQTELTLAKVCSSHSHTARCAMAQWPQLSRPVMSYYFFYCPSIDCMTTLEYVTTNWTRETFLFGCWCHLSLSSFLIGFVFINTLYWFQSCTDMTCGLFIGNGDFYRLLMEFQHFSLMWPSICIDSENEQALASLNNIFLWLH